MSLKSITQNVWLLYTVPMSLRKSVWLNVFMIFIWLVECILSWWASVDHPYLHINSTYLLASSTWACTPVNCHKVSLPDPCLPNCSPPTLTSHVYRSLPLTYSPYRSHALPLMTLTWGVGNDNPAIQPGKLAGLLPVPLNHHSSAGQAAEVDVLPGACAQWTVPIPRSAACRLCPGLRYSPFQVYLFLNNTTYFSMTVIHRKWIIVWKIFLTREPTKYSK